MARPLKNKKDQELLADQEIYRLIKQHPEVKACKQITIEQIRAVFRAYSDIVYTASKRGIRVSLPRIGQFLSTETKGWQGGFITFLRNFNDTNSKERAYFPPKPNYRLLRFDFHKAIRNKFRKETEIPFDKKTLKRMKEEAEKREKELIASGKIDLEEITNIHELMGDSDE